MDLEPFIAVGLTLITFYAVKLSIFGRGPIRRPRSRETERALEQRVTELEDRLDQHEAEVGGRHDDRIADLEDRLDFAERMLAQYRCEELEPPGKPRASTPV